MAADGVSAAAAIGEAADRQFERRGHSVRGSDGGSAPIIAGAGVVGQGGLRQAGLIQRCSPLHPLTADLHACVAP
jgi:hypothetical protein